MSDLDPTRHAEPDPEATTVVPVQTAPLTPAAGPTHPGDQPTYPIEQPLETDVTWAAAVPVKPPASPSSSRARRLRWAAAIAVVAVVLGASAAVAALITSAASRATVLGYVPADSVAYVEARLDLPGDQRRAVGEFLSHFPGF